MTHTPAKYNLIFGKMSSADFYPEGRDNEIDVIVAAPKETRIWPGEVVIMDKEIYSELLGILKGGSAYLRAIKDYLKDYLKEQESISYLDDALAKLQIAINKAEGK